MLVVSGIRVICVFCGAGGKMPELYKSTAFQLGSELAKRNLALLTGGANVGTMKEVVDGHATTNPDGLRYGVLPDIFKEFNIDHPLIPVDNMHWPVDLHARLKKFYEICDDIIVLPGGFGTIHELMDCLVHSQFGIIKKRIYLLNINNFWDHLIKQFAVMIAEYAVEPKHVAHLIVVNSLDELLTSLEAEDVADLAQGLKAMHWENN